MGKTEIFRTMISTVNAQRNEMVNRHSIPGYDLVAYVTHPSITLDQQPHNHVPVPGHVFLVRNSFHVTMLCIQRWSSFGITNTLFFFKNWIILQSVIALSCTSPILFFCFFRRIKAFSHDEMIA